MQNHEIDALIDRARRAWLRRPEFDGRTPVIKDSDIVIHGKHEFVELRDGDELIALFMIRSNGEISYRTINRH